MNTTAAKKETLFEENEEEAAKKYIKAEPVYMKKLLERLSSSDIAAHLGLSLTTVSRSREIPQIAMVHEVAAEGLWFKLYGHEGRAHSAVIFGDQEAIATCEMLITKLGGKIVHLQNQ